MFVIQPQSYDMNSHKKKYFAIFNRINYQPDNHVFLKLADWSVTVHCQMTSPYQA